MLSMSELRTARLDKLQDALDRRRGYIIGSVFIGVIKDGKLHVFDKQKTERHVFDIDRSPRHMLMSYEVGYIEGRFEFNDPSEKTYGELLTEVSQYMQSRGAEPGEWSKS